MITGLLGAGALLLLVAGASKAADPSRTAGALATLGWTWATPTVVRGAAIGETVLAAAALTVGSPVLAGLVAFSYLGFAAFVAYALRSGRPIGSCGCFGRADTPPSLTHIGVNLALGAGAAAAGVIDATPLVEASAPAVGGASAIAVAAGSALVLPSRR